MLFIKYLPETTNGEDIFSEVIQYINGENIQLTNLLNIASDGAAAMTGKEKGFVSTMKSVASHIFYVHVPIHRWHLAAWNIGSHMQDAFNTVIHAIYFVQSK